MCAREVTQGIKVLSCKCLMFALPVSIPNPIHLSLHGNVRGRTTLDSESASLLYALVTDKETAPLRTERKAGRTSRVAPHRAEGRTDIQSWALLPCTPCDTPFLLTCSHSTNAHIHIHVDHTQIPPTFYNTEFCSILSIKELFAYREKLDHTRNNFGNVIFNLKISSLQSYKQIFCGLEYLHIHRYFYHGAQIWSSYCFM